MSQQQSTLKLIWRQERLIPIGFGIGSADMLLLIITWIYYPRDIVEAVIGGAVALIMSLFFYWQREYIFAIGGPHAEAKVIGIPVSLDLFYFKSNLRGDSIDLEPDRFETPLFLKQEMDWTDIFPDEHNHHCRIMYIQHWDTFENRVGRMQGIALAGGVPIVHSNSETMILFPLKDTPPKQHDDGFYQAPTFELLWTIAGDASMEDLEAFMIGWRTVMRRRREREAVRGLARRGIKPPKGMTPRKFLDHLGDNRTAVLALVDKSKNGGDKKEEDAPTR